MEYPIGRGPSSKVYGRMNQLKRGLLKGGCPSNCSTSYQALVFWLVPARLSRRCKCFFWLKHRGGAWGDGTPPSLFLPCIFERAANTLLLINSQFSLNRSFFHRTNWPQPDNLPSYGTNLSWYRLQNWFAKRFLSHILQIQLRKRSTPSASFCMIPWTIGFKVLLLWTGTWSLWGKDCCRCILRPADGVCCLPTRFCSWLPKTRFSIKSW